MTDRIKLANRLLEIACKCDKTDHSQRSCDLNEIEGGKSALYDAIELLRKGLGKSTDEGWPMNLLLDIGIVCTLKEAEAIEENLMYAIESLRERDRQIVILRYKEGKTYEEISDLIGVSKQRPHELIHRILRNLSRPERIDVICNGRESFNSYLKHKDDFVNSLSQLKSEIGEVKEHIKASESEENDITELSLYEKPIAYLGLSIRLQNALRRSGFEKINDLKKVTRAQLLRTRNLGPKAVEEIIEKAKEYGFEIV